VQAQKMFCELKVAITNTGQQNHQPNCAAICVLLAAKERAKCISAPDVMWPVRGALFDGISYQSKFVNHSVCEYCML